MRDLVLETDVFTLLRLDILGQVHNELLSYLFDVDVECLI